MTLSALIKRSIKASTKAESATDAAILARKEMHREAIRLAWAALVKRGISRHDRIGFIDPKVAKRHETAPGIALIEAYRPLVGEAEWRVTLKLTIYSARGKALKTPGYASFDLAHPRDIAKRVVKVAP